MADGRFFGYPQGVGKGQHLHRQPHLDPLSTGSYGAGADQRGGHYRTLRTEVGLADPEGIDALLLGLLDQPEPFLEGIELAASFPDGEHGKYAEVHGLLL